MATQQTEETLDQHTVDALSTAFNRCFETLDAPEGLFTDDAFFDLLPPFWRFQFEGPQAFASQLRAISTGPATARVLRVVPTARGFVMEHEETAHVEGMHDERTDGETTEVARRLWLCNVRDGRIAEVVGYCNGGWDDELRSRHLTEAPMLRP